MSVYSFVAVVVTVVWAVSLIAAIVLPGYTPPVELHAIMGLLAGSLFGKDAYDRAKKGRNGDG